MYRKELQRYLNGRTSIITCGCGRDETSKAFFYWSRRKLFRKIRKEGDHWIVQTKQRKEGGFLPHTQFRNVFYSFQRLAYLFWNHLEELPKDSCITAKCGVGGCVKPSHLVVMPKLEFYKLTYKGKINGNDARI